MLKWQTIQSYKVHVHNLKKMLFKACVFKKASLTLVVTLMLTCRHHLTIKQGIRITIFFFFVCGMQQLDVGSQFPNQGLNLGHSNESKES